jgi:3-methylcrotonyl-CoA carboxylase alpha subunit
MPFSSVLIANRGEIACRIIRTCRRLGIRTVAVYSEADADAQHARLADSAVSIGGSAPRDSYLRGEVIIAAALANGAQAIHPGYGFLSENADFADAVAAAGLTFIGPSGVSMRKMGSKAGAKDLMAAANVPVVPGYTGEDQSTACLQQEADRIGYPLMIKAAHGGGGKGMRIVRASSEFAGALQSCQREAANAFGRDRVLLERYLETPRHIEIQIFGDQLGQVIHLGERECSAQRRYQKSSKNPPRHFSPQRHAKRWVPPRLRQPKPSITSTQAPWNSSSHPAAISTSWKSIRDCRSNIRSLKWSPASIWSSGNFASLQASHCPLLT